MAKRLAAKRLGAKRLGARRLGAKRFGQHEAVQRLLASVIGLYLTFVVRTGRWRFEADAETSRLLSGFGPERAIVVCWHEYVGLMPAFCLRARRINPAVRVTALISRNADGRLIARVLGRWGVRSVDGSSAKPGKTGKGGAAALRGLLDRLRDGSFVVIMTDGPRGPRRVMQPGTALLASLSGLRVVPVAFACRPGPRLATWDRMVLPLPFARGTILCGQPLSIGGQDRAEATARIAAALNRLDGLGPAG